MGTDSEGALSPPFKITGKNIQPKLLPVRAGDVFKTLVDISKIKEKLGYNPRVDFEKGLKRTVEYFCSQKSLQAEMVK